MTLFCPECGDGFDDSLSVCPTDGVRLYAVSSTQAPLIGEVLEGRFRLEGLLGTGGMGAVYRAIQTSVGRNVAVKVLHADLDDDQAALERFFREAKFVSELTHPSIVRVIDFGQDPRLEILYLVMELIEGPTLDKLLRGTRLSVDFALEVAYQVCGGLTEPHASHVVHRDLKPANLFVNPVSDGSIQVKICDFGIARALTRSTRLTVTGGICGTPTYMSPEQATDRELDSRTDLYSLGVILYQMLTGWLPFNAASSLQLMLKHVQETPPPLAQLLTNDPLPASVERLVTDLMQKSPDARPASARVVRDRIGGIRAELGLSPIQLDAITKGGEPSNYQDIFSPWMIASEPHRQSQSAPQPDSHELAYALTQAHSSTDTQLLGPSMTETNLLDTPPQQTPHPANEQTGEVSNPMAMERVPTDKWGLGNQGAASRSAPASPQRAHIAPTPTQNTAPQPTHSDERPQKTSPSSSSTSKYLLPLLFTLVIGALVVASVALWILWANTDQTSTEDLPNATPQTSSAITPGDDSTQNALAAPEVKPPKVDAPPAADDDKARDDDVEQPSVKKTPTDRPKPKDAPKPERRPAQAKPKSPANKPSPEGKSGAKSPSTPPRSGVSPKESASEQETPGKQSPRKEAPKKKAPQEPTDDSDKPDKSQNKNTPKNPAKDDSSEPNTTDASKRLDEIFGTHGLRNE